MFLVLFIPNINGYFIHGNLVLPAFQDGILMAILVHQYPYDYDSDWREGVSSKPKQEHYEKKHTDSRVRLVRKRMVHLTLGKKRTYL